jgi:lysophospholipase L1-like esterase
MSTIKANACVLFQGDSITDAGRSRGGASGLGEGYAMMAAAWFGAIYPKRGVTFINRGVSGERTADLVQRWEKDCLELKPDWVSLLVGINDTWRGVDQGDVTSTEIFEFNYRRLLRPVKEKLRAPIILLEPFVLPNHTAYDAMRGDLDHKLEAVRKMAREFETLLVPLDGLFQQACTQTPPEHWSMDGVHLTPAGHAFVARAWLRTVGVPT